MDEDQKIAFGRGATVEGAGISVFDGQRFICDDVFDLRCCALGHHDNVVGRTWFIDRLEPFAGIFDLGFLNHRPQIHATGHAFFERDMVQIVVHARGAIACESGIYHR